MFIEERGSDCRSLESIGDQVSASIRDAVQASRSDLMARGVTIVGVIGHGYPKDGETIIQDIGASKAP